MIINKVQKSVPGNYSFPLLVEYIKTGTLFLFTSQDAGMAICDPDFIYPIEFTTGGINMYDKKFWRILANGEGVELIQNQPCLPNYKPTGTTQT